MAPEFRQMQIIPRSRIDALTDGIFAFAMTLSALVSIVVPRHAMYTYLLNLPAGPLAARCWASH